MYFNSDDNDSDPDYDPTTEDVKKKRKLTLDYFNLIKTEDEAEFSDQPSTSTSTSSQTSRPTKKSVTVDESTSCFLEDFSRYGYIDGKFFTVVSRDEKRVKTQCQLCLPKIHFIKGIIGVSTNFVKHIKTVHENSLEHYQQYLKQKKRKYPVGINENATPSVQQQTQEYWLGSRSPISQKEFEQRIIAFVTNTMSAISVLDNKYFIDIFQGMNLKVITSKTAMVKIRTLNEEITDSIKTELQAVEYVCTTTDIWSAKKISFLGVTCHWLDSDFNRYSVALACKRLPTIHPVDKTAELLEEIHNNFKLGNKKIVATVTDNGSNFVEAFEDLGVTVSPKLLQRSIDSADEALDLLDDELIQPLFAQIDADVNDPEHVNENIFQLVLPRHKRSASHTINLIAVTDVKNAINKNNTTRNWHTTVMNKCSVLWQKSSFPKSAEIIKNVIGDYFSYPCITRWDSYFDCVNQILKNKDKLNDLFLQLGLKNEFNEHEIIYLEEYCKILQPLSIALNILQGESNTYYGYLLPCLISVKIKLSKMKNENLHLTGHILDACIEGIGRRFFNLLTLSDTENDAIIAAFTIPKFKLRWFNGIKNESVKDLNDIKKVIMEAAKTLMPQLQTTITTAEVGKRTDYDDFFDFAEESSKNVEKWTIQNNDRTDIEIEILQYIESNDQELISLNKFPIIKKLFMRYNTCLPSSAPVERLFSFASLINSPKTHALTDDDFENLALLKANGSFEP